jgi:hypothetical protein
MSYKETRNEFEAKCHNEHALWKKYTSKKFFNLKMEAPNSFEILEHIYKSTRYSIP